MRKPDICVIGSGPAGAIVAVDLVEAGFRVLPGWEELLAPEGPELKLFAWAPQPFTVGPWLKAPTARCPPWRCAGMPPSPSCWRMRSAS